MGPPASSGFVRAQIEQIRRTVTKTPEAMIKVTGGSQTPGALAAHLSYLSHHGELDLETDKGQQVSRQEQKAMFKDWHLELCSGQYRGLVMREQGVAANRQNFPP